VLYCGYMTNLYIANTGSMTAIICLTLCIC